MAVRVKGKSVLVMIWIFGFLFGVAQPLALLSNGQVGSLSVSNSYWLGLASNAWNYFQPGVGVDPNTGLHDAGLGYPYFTDWDLGVYIQAIIGVNRLGILGTDGTWGASDRFNRILSFLENRALSATGIPFVWYQAANGNPNSNSEQDPYDAGELLVALYDLENFRPDLADTINHIVYTRTNYAPLEQQVDTFATANTKDLYDYYAASGFACFWQSRFSAAASSILNTIVSSTPVSAYGASLPTSTLTCDPLLLCAFGLPSNAQVQSLAQTVYSASQARYSSTGKFTAFGEGNTGLSNPSYVYEYVVTSSGSTWVVEDPQFNVVGIVPIAYFKVAVGLLAMFDSSFTENMVSSVESQLPSPSSGYCDGVDESGRVDPTTIDKTNSMIIQAAQYATSGSPSPTPTPRPTPTPTLSSSPTASPSPSPTSSPTPSPTATPDPTSTPTAAPTSTPSPTPIPKSSPTPSPTSAPTPLPTPAPTPSPIPTPSPTAIPSASPTSSPTSSPTNAPVQSSEPTAIPAVASTVSPSSTSDSKASPSATPSLPTSSSQTRSSASKSSSPNASGMPVGSTSESGSQGVGQFVGEPIFYVPVSAALAAFVAGSVFYLRKRR